ncbi:MBL fold metallo-hydrolase [Candidatus Azambacteria bacterium]|nr:MBL fold metallo-hydrolase [Candidatus Azambacteria bacterium]
MQITWYGLSCFKITNGETTILMSPFGKNTGLNPPKGKADIVLISENGESSYDGSDFVISGEGEYEAKGILVNGFSFFRSEGSKMKKTTVYTLHIDGISVCHLDTISKEHVDALLEKIGEVDVLIIPVGGAHHKGKEEIKTLNAEEAVAVVAEIEPRIVIPMYYKVPKLSVGLQGPESFLKAMGCAGIDPVEKLSVKRKDLPQEETKVIVLSCGN